MVTTQTRAPNRQDQARPNQGTELQSDPTGHGNVPDEGHVDSMTGMA